MNQNMRNEELIMHWLIKVNEKLDILAHKMGVNRDDLHSYFIARTKGEDYTDKAKTELQERLNNFLKILNKIEK
jgi:hypothetical protein